MSVFWCPRCRKFNILGTFSKVLNLEESSGCLAAEFRHLVRCEKQTDITAHNKYNIMSNDTFIVDLSFPLITTAIKRDEM